jgi:molecular chaperone HtpG
VAAVRKALTNRVLSELKKLSEKDKDAFIKIWDLFAPVIKEGLYEDFERREQIFEFARFKSTKAEGLTLREYAKGLKENQTSIYYITAEDAAKAAASPQLEGYKARDIEVLLLTDPVDSFWIRTAMGFDGKPFVSVNQGASDLDKIKPATATEEKKPDDPALGKLIAAFKEALGERVKDVRVSDRLTDSAVCIVNDGQLDRALERMLSRQKDSGVSVSAPVLEINGSHAMIKALAAKADAGVDLVDAAHLLLDQAFILEGEVVADPAGFGRRLSALMEQLYA